MNQHTDGPASTGVLRDLMFPGGSFVLDIPATVPAIWGNGTSVLWSQGEACIISGPPGVGKTTLTGQVIRGLLGLTPTVLGYTVQPAQGRVLYLAMDRPQQIARALARHFTSDERELLDENLVIWKGPPPSDLAKYPEMLTQLAEQAGASHVILDSLKDAALGLSEDEVGASYNRARQTALAAGVEVLELHHTVKKGHAGAKPNRLADLYGSVWISAGAGSVVLLWGEAGDLIVELTHLKQPAETVGPFKVLHDHEAGLSTVWEQADPLLMAKAAGDTGLTVMELAAAMFDTAKLTDANRQTARRRLDNLVKSGHLEAWEGPDPVRGGRPEKRYRASTRASTDPFLGESSTEPETNYEKSIIAGPASTKASTRSTDPSKYEPVHPFKGVRSTHPDERDQPTQGAVDLIQGLLGGVVVDDEPTTPEGGTS